MFYVTNGTSEFAVSKFKEQIAIHHKNLKRLRRGETSQNKLVDGEKGNQSSKLERVGGGVSGQKVAGV